MNKSVQLLTALALVVSAININNKAMAQSATVNDSVVMGAGYANEVYYSMQNGQVLSSPRNTWDIAFRTRVMSSSILINDGKSVVLYTYPKSDTSGWSSVDTTGLFEWIPMYNDPNDWENGAFSRNATGGFDFGWGVYNQSTHYITGDSLFIIQTRNGDYRKLWIQVKKSGEDITYFRYANLDGTDEHNVVLDCNPLKSKDFIGYSLETNDTVSYQPLITDWDIVFTKYMSVQPNGQPYPVTGVLDNDVIYAQKFKHVNTSFIGYDPLGWDSTRSVIGYDWKMFDGSVYQIVDSLVCFVKNKQKEIYKIVFTGFDGSTTGRITFGKTELARVGVNEKFNNTENVLVFPNPVKDKMVIIFSGQDSHTRKLLLRDLSGRIVAEKEVPGSGSDCILDATSLAPGIYMLQVTSGGQSIIEKVIISR